MYLADDSGRARSTSALKANPLHGTAIDHVSTQRWRYSLSSSGIFLSSVSMSTVISFSTMPSKPHGPGPDLERLRRILDVLLTAELVIIVVAGRDSSLVRSRSSLYFGSRLTGYSPAEGSAAGASARARPGRPPPATRSVPSPIAFTSWRRCRKTLSSVARDSGSSQPFFTFSSIADPPFVFIRRYFRPPAASIQMTLM